MKIAFISYDLGEYSIRHANALLAHGDVMLVLAQQLAAPYEGMLDPAVDYRPFAKPRLRQPVAQLSIMRWILHQVREFAPDVIHFQMGHLWFNFALPRLKRYPLVFTIHDPRHHVGDRGSRNTPQWVMDYGFRRADQVIVHGSQLQDVVRDATGLAGDRVHVIPHIAVGLDAARQTDRQVDEDDTILFFGRIWEYKGLEYLIRAQPRISQRFPKVRIVIGGQGDDFARYRQLMVDPTKFIVHNRWISDEERARLFDAASVVVLPYIEATQSGVVPVAYAHGKPVVATRTGGLPDCVEHERTGLLVPPRDEIALAEAVTKLLADPVLRRSLGEAGRQKLADEFSPEVVAAQTAEVYQLAIEQHRGGVRTTACQQDTNYDAETATASHAPACGRVGLSGPERVAPGRPFMTTNDSFSDCTLAAERLHAYLVQQHWRGDGLYGPDPGIRINYRIGRFAKSYLAFIPWQDDMYYLQCQGYWVLINWELYRRTGESAYRELAMACSAHIAETQLDDGCWRYPNKEWHSRVATVEGIWACLAMMATYERTQEGMYLDAVLRWNKYLLTEIGFQTIGDELAINYFANQTYRARVPNNSADALRYFSGLAALTDDSRHLEPCTGLLRFLANVQKPTGEFAYTVPGETNDRIRPHFQCYQYNAFMCLGIMRYWELTGDERARPIVEGILRFLPDGLTESGATHYACGITYRHVTYHSAALAAALVRAGQLGFTNCDASARRAFDFVLRNQQPSGGFNYSRGDYRCLRDKRSYPRAMTMILYHLLHPYLEPSHRIVPELSA